MTTQTKHTEAKTTDLKPGYKKTKLGWIPEEWELKKIGDLAKIKHGRNQKDVVCDNGKYPILGTGGVIGWTNISLYDRPSVMIGRKGTIDKPRYMTTPFWTVDTLFYTEIKDNTIPKWLFYNFQSINWYFYNEATGVPSLSASNISAIKIPYPKKEEQKAIANCLNTWDNAIQNLSKLIEKKEDQKKGLMQQLLTGKKRLTGFDGEWETKKLGEYFSERKERGLDNLELLSIGEAGVYPQSDSNKKDTSNNDKSKYKRICVGDIGYNSMRMWQGRSALSSLEGIVSPAYTIVKPLKNGDSVFFSYLFKLNEMIHKFYRNSQGMVSDTWMCKFKDFKIVKFNAPPSKDEQTAIASVLQKSDEEIALLNKKLDQLKEQKKGLMQQLLTGKKRLKY